MTTLNTPGGTKQLKKIVFFGHFGVANFGNESSLKAVLCHLRRVLPNAEFNCICSDPSAVARTYDIAAVSSRSSLKAVLCHLRRVLPNAEFNCICSDPSAVARTYDIAAVSSRAPVGGYRTLHRPLARLARRLVV